MKSCQQHHLKNLYIQALIMIEKKYYLDKGYVYLKKISNQKNFYEIRAINFKNIIKGLLIK